MTYRSLWSPLRIHIGFNFYGAGNIGDDLMLGGLIKSLGSLNNRVELTCCTPFDISSQRLRFPELTWLPDDEKNRALAIDNAHVWLGLGDTPFQNACGLWMRDHLLAQWAEVSNRGIPMFYLGVGAEGKEVLNDPGFRALVVRAEKIWCRDKTSQAWISPHAHCCVSTGADVCHAYFGNVSSARPTGSRHVDLGLVLAFENPEQHLDIAAVSASMLAHGDLAWIVQEVRNFYGTEQNILERLPENLRNRANVAKPDYHRAPSVADLLDAWPTPNVLASSRYHALCTMAWRGSKLVAIERSGKLNGAAEDLGIPLVHCSALNDGIARARSVESGRLNELADVSSEMLRSFWRTVGVLPAHKQRSATKQIAVAAVSADGQSSSTLNPLLEGLRDLWPTAAITMYVAKNALKLGDLCPCVDEIVPIDDSAVLRSNSDTIPKYDLLFVPAFFAAATIELDLVKQLDADQKWGFVNSGSYSALTHAVQTNKSSNDPYDVNLALLGAFLPRSVRGNSRRSNRWGPLARLLSPKARRNPLNP